MRYVSEYVGHTLTGIGGEHFVAVEYEPSCGLWIQSLTHPRGSKALRNISEAAIDRTFHHKPLKCAKCQARSFDGLRARDVWKRRYVWERTEGD